MSQAQLSACNAMLPCPAKYHGKVGRASSAGVSSRSSGASCCAAAARRGTSANGSFTTAYARSGQAMHCPSLSRYMWYAHAGTYMAHGNTLARAHDVGHPCAEGGRTVCAQRLPDMSTSGAMSRGNMSASAHAMLAPPSAASCVASTSRASLRGRHAAALQRTHSVAQLV